MPTPNDENRNAPHAVSTATVRAVLLDLLDAIEGALCVYRQALLRADPAPSGNALRELADFADWAALAVEQGRAILLQDERGGYEYGIARPGSIGTPCLPRASRRGEPCMQTAITTQDVQEVRCIDLINSGNPCRERNAAAGTTHRTSVAARTASGIANAGSGQTFRAPAPHEVGSGRHQSRNGRLGGRRSHRPACRRESPRRHIEHATAGHETVGSNALGYCADLRRPASANHSLTLRSAPTASCDSSS